MISWPAILKYHGEDELVFIASQAQWNKDPDLFYYAYQDNDLLFDAKGVVYKLDQIEDQYVTPTSTKRTASLSEIEDMLKAHMSALGHCCIAKMAITSIHEAIVMVGEAEEM